MSEKKIHSGRIDKVLRGKYCNNWYNLSNTFIYKWESDFFTVSTSGYAYEIEIKISRSDYKADFKKGLKHQLLADPMSKTYYNGKPYRVPNKFYFCCPKGLIRLDEVPFYAGLIYTDGFSTTVVKPAPFIHKVKQDLNKILLKKFYFLSLDLQRTIAIGQREFNYKF